MFDHQLLKGGCIMLHKNQQNFKRSLQCLSLKLSLVRTSLCAHWKDLFNHDKMNQMHNLEKAADRKSVRKIFGRPYAPPNTLHVKNTEGPAHACERQEPGCLATLWSHSIRPTRSVNIPSSPGGGETSQRQETASMTDTRHTVTPSNSPPNPPQTIMQTLIHLLIHQTISWCWHVRFMFVTFGDFRWIPITSSWVTDVSYYLGYYLGESCLSGKKWLSQFILSTQM